MESTALSARPRKPSEHNCEPHLKLSVFVNSSPGTVIYTTRGSSKPRGDRAASSSSANVSHPTVRQELFEVRRQEPCPTR